MLKGNQGRVGRGRWLTTLVCAAVLTAGQTATAESTADDLARRHFDSGAAYLQESDYENALRAFQKAYDLSGRAAILLNIATVHERTGDLPSAIAALEQYLKLEPEGDHAETTRNRLANLQKRHEELNTSPTETPAEAPPAPAEPAVSPQPESNAAPAPAVSEQPITLPAEANAGPSVLGLVLLGIGGLSAAGAGVTGYLAGAEWRDAQDACSPNCTDDELSTGRAMAWTSTILTGTALVGVGLGVFLLLTDDTGEQPPPATTAALPRILVGAGPAGAAASASWRF